MVYFLKPSYSLRYAGDFNVMEGNNMYYIGGTAAVLIIAVVLYVFFQRPTFLGCCDKDDKDEKGKPKVNWMKTSALAVAVGIVGALAVYGGLWYANSKKSQEVVSPSASM